MTSPPLDATSQFNHFTGCERLSSRSTRSQRIRGRKEALRTTSLRSTIVSFIDKRSDWRLELINLTPQFVDVDYNVLIRRMSSGNICAYVILIAIICKWNNVVSAIIWYVNEVRRRRQKYRNVQWYFSRKLALHVIGWIFNPFWPGVLTGSERLKSIWPRVKNMRHNFRTNVSKP